MELLKESRDLRKPFASTPVLGAISFDGGRTTDFGADGEVYKERQ
jgi:hypothetical protein